MDDNHQVMEEIEKRHIPIVLSNRSSLKEEIKDFNLIESLINDMSKFMVHMNLDELTYIAEKVCNNTNVERLINSKVSIEVKKYYKSTLGEIFYIYEEIFGCGNQYFMGQSKECIFKFDKAGRCSSLDYFDWLIEESSQVDFKAQQVDKYRSHHMAFESLKSMCKALEKSEQYITIQDNIKKSKFKENS